MSKPISRTIKQSDGSILHVDGYDSSFDCSGCAYDDGPLCLLGMAMEEIEPGEFQLNPNCSKPKYDSCMEVD